jgi:hypothetical protein
MEGEAQPYSLVERPQWDVVAGNWYYGSTNQ